MKYSTILISPDRLTHNGDLFTATAIKGLDNLKNIPVYTNKNSGEMHDIGVLLKCEFKDFNLLAHLEIPDSEFSKLGNFAVLPNYTVLDSHVIDGITVIYRAKMSSITLIRVPDKTLEVHLTYFRKSGKFCSSCSYKTSYKALFRIWEEVEDKLRERTLPGLVKGHDNKIVLVDVPDHEDNHPHLVIYEDTDDCTILPGA